MIRYLGGNYVEWDWNDHMVEDEYMHGYKWSEEYYKVLVDTFWFFHKDKHVLQTILPLHKYGIDQGVHTAEGKYVIYTWMLKKSCRYT